jgi:oxygen-independent coproporphyrinogen-3 oxidase
MAIEQASSAGFSNFSLDLIYGLPELTNEKWYENLRKGISLNPAHISCYALTVEPKTALFNMIQTKKTPDVQPEKQADQFLIAIQELEAAGFEHYEISSFAKPGRRSRHNSAYWQSKKYLGLGPAAHSFNGTGRQWNIANNSLYIKALLEGQLKMESENLLPRDLLNEYIMTSLRTIEGLDLQKVSDQFGNEKSLSLENSVKKYIQSKKIERKEEKLILTNSGKLFADGIAASLFFD